MRKQLVAFGLVTLAVVMAAGLFLHGKNIQVLNSKGPIAAREKNLMIATVFLSLFVIVPVYIMTFYIAWKYRADNKPAKYEPDWDHSFKAELAWWAIPGVIILALSVVTWRSAHSLDPARALADSPAPALNVQVVALDWKWLFIYPNQHVASVNLAEVPVNTPLNLEITADAPMNSFWVPQLGGQIYAMPGMATQLHLMANQTGDYRGSSANISGAGFAGMDFTVRSVSPTAFAAWTSQARGTKAKLTAQTYAQLLKPSQNNVFATYKLQDSGLFDQVINKYMMNMAGGAK